MARCPEKSAWALQLLAIAMLVGCSAAGEPTLEQVRAAAERYRDVRVAIAEGYTTDNKCVTAEMLGFPAEQGAMGLHYVRRDLLGLPAMPAAPVAGTVAGRVAGLGTYTDFARPAMLVYEPQADGSMTLVAVENLVFKKAWEAAGNAEPPSFRGNPYLLLADDPATPLDEAHGFEPHYELHAWVIRDNPLGMFAAFSPKVTCRHHQPPPGAASSPAMQHAPAAAAAPAAAPVDPAKAIALVKSGALLVDVREPSELAASGRLEGAVNRPMSAFAKQAAALPRDRPIVLYCRSGRRSEMAGKVLQSLGFAQIYNLGSFEAAVSAGMERAAR